MPRKNVVEKIETGALQPVQIFGKSYVFRDNKAGCVKTQNLCVNEHIYYVYFQNGLFDVNSLTCVVSFLQQLTKDKEQQ